MHFFSLLAPRSRVISVALIATATSLASLSVFSQSAILPYREYEKRLEASQRVSPLDENAFGAEVSLYSGSTSFRAVDIDIPGNNGLPVQLSRRMQVEDRTNGPVAHLGGMADWEIEVPYIAGTFANSTRWRTGASPGSTSRCSNAVEPTIPGTWDIKDVWQGNQLSLPGRGGETLFRNNFTSTVPQPTDGPAYPWMTASGLRIKCLTSLANGEPGEGFLAVATDGTKYWFNWLVYKATRKITDPIKTSNATLDRVKGYMLATRIEDRHGNSVTYTYTGSNLTGISASDGRAISLTWTGDRVTSASSEGRIWTYAYKSGSGSPWLNGPGLERVTLPDGSTWEYGATGSLFNTETWQPSLENPGYTCPPFPAQEHAFNYTVKHPAGSTMSYAFQSRRHQQTRVPWICQSGTTPSGGFYETLVIPGYFDTVALTSRTLSGPAVPSHTWTYTYGESSGNPYCYQDPFSGVWTCNPPITNCAAQGTCPPIADAKYVTVTETGGRTARLTFGTGFDTNDGRLLVEETLQGSTLLTKTDHTFITDAEVTSQPFAPAMGTNQVQWQPLSTLNRPVRRKLITQQGATFESYVNSFDTYVRPTSTRQRTQGSSGTNGDRTEVKTYDDHTASWTVGQPKTAQYSGTTHPSYSITYHAASRLPHTLTEHGLLRETYAYNANGTISTITDARNYSTSLTNWFRGIPRTLSFPNSTSKSATVNGSGWITSVTDENGFMTSYGHDNMGRVTSVTPPSGDAVAWSPTSISFTPVASTEYGIPGTHWRRVESRGGYRKETYFDGLWRPVIEREYDNASITATQRFKGWQYNVDGKVVFEGYPLTSATGISSFTAGTTSSYDALGRPLSVSRTSEPELGGLTITSYSYLTGFQTRVTDPRTAQTTTSYQTFDQPDISRPTTVSGPEGVTTALARDAYFGKPTSIQRFGGGNSITRTYAYDAHQRLCKQIDPETAATIFDYDANSNIVWSATGLGLTGNATTCDRQWVGASDKTIRTYDSMNRVTLVDFPDASVDVSTIYTPDGLIDTLTAAPHVWKYQYNRLRLPTNERLEHTYQGSVYPYPTSWTYTPLGHRASMVAGNGLTVAYSPNALGQPTQAGTFATGATYFPDGSLKSFTYGNGTIRTVEKNARLLPRRIADIRSGVTILDDRYLYDANGNLTNQDDQLNLAGGDRTLSYDYRDRLTGAQISGTQTETFTYDALDNIRTRQFGSQVSTYNYGTQWRLDSISGLNAQTFGYDLRGNMTTRAGRTHTFDRANRLLSVSGTGGASHEYDGHGRRTVTWRNSGTSKVDVYTADGVLRYASDGSRSGVVVYVHLGSQLVAERFLRWDGAGGEAIEYVHGDLIGSSVARTTTTGAITERERSLSYGQALDGSKREAPGFTGHMEDPGIGLVYMQQRYYDPAIGRFLSVDNVQALSDPASRFGLYHYARNNPYRFVDFDGNQECDSRSIACRPGISGALYSNGPIGEVPSSSGKSESDQPQPQRITTASALAHYKAGSGSALRMAFSDIDTTEVTVDYFDEVDTLIDDADAGAYGIDDRKAFSTSGEEAGYLGNITLRLQGRLILTDDTYEFKGTLKSFDDTYDFNRSSHRSIIGEALTALGGQIEGRPFDIQIRGAKEVNESGER